MFAPSLVRVSAVYYNYWSPAVPDGSCGPFVGGADCLPRQWPTEEESGGHAHDQVEGRGFLTLNWRRGCWEQGSPLVFVHAHAGSPIIHKHPVVNSLSHNNKKKREERLREQVPRKARTRRRFVSRPV
jgi:hypothetical protein